MVERTLGKGEVGSSILPSSTIPFFATETMSSTLKGKVVSIVPYTPSGEHVTGFEKASLRTILRTA